MTERPILFSTPMIKSILAGKKTATRRIVKPQPPDDAGALQVGRYAPTKVDRNGLEYPGEEIFGATTLDGEWGVPCPFGGPGDRLWVREAFARREGVVYRADLPDEDEARDWRPSIFMPRELSRITLTIKDVRVERLQEITEAAALTEGVEPRMSSESWTGYDPKTESHPTAFARKTLEHAGCIELKHHPPRELASAREEFRRLWEALNYKKCGWETNPLVWVVEFTADIRRS